MVTSVNLDTTSQLQAMVAIKKAIVPLVAITVVVAIVAITTTTTITITAITTSEKITRYAHIPLLLASAISHQVNVPICMA